MKKLKKARFDFVESNLPSNRKEVFCDCFKLRFGLLFKLGLLLLVFAIPLLISMFMMDNAVYSLYENSESINDAGALILQTINIFNLINIPLLVILSLCLAGIFRIIRQLVWGEPIFFASDFIEGIKLNGKAFAVIFLLVGIVNYFCSFAFYSTFGNVILSVLPLAIALMFLFPVGLLMLSLQNTYNISVKSSFVNSLLLFIKEFPKIILCSLIMSIPFVLLFVSSLVRYLIIILVLIFIAPLLIMGLYLFACYLFDKHINVKNYPDYVDKGIVRRHE